MGLLTSLIVRHGKLYQFRLMKLGMFQPIVFDGVIDKFSVLVNGSDARVVPAVATEELISPLKGLPTVGAPYGRCALVMIVLADESWTPVRKDDELVRMGVNIRLVDLHPPGVLDRLDVHNREVTLDRWLEEVNRNV